MDERYLSCGKRMDNGEWIEGYHLCYAGKSWILPVSDIDNDSIYIFDLLVDVDPSTIGQCTGLRDKNGKLIFEGDIVAVPKYPDSRRWVIRWVEAALQFWAIDDTGYGSPAESFLSWVAVAGREQPEIIGNIYDNPELLQPAT